MLHSFDYAVLRVVPRVDRAEFINAGVILFCLQQKFLSARVHLSEARISALWPQLEIAPLKQHVDACTRICAGDKSAGPIAHLSVRERFHWLVAPRSAVIQVSPVHSGLCEDPAPTLERLFSELVLIEGAESRS